MTEDGNRTSASQERSYSLILSDGTEYAVPPGRSTIGRELDCALVVADPVASRHHAEICIRDGSLFIFDLASANGTWLNGERLTTEQPLTDGDILEIGDTRLVVRVDVHRTSVTSDAAIEEPTLMPLPGSPDARLRISVSEPFAMPDGLTAIIALHGILDDETSEPFRAAVAPLVAAVVVHFKVKLDELESVDSAGLGALVSLHREVKSQAGTVELQSPQTAVRAMLHLTRLDREFRIV